MLHKGTVMSFINKISNRMAVSPWPGFARQVRGKQEKLLIHLDEFPDSILVSGCQRSGTTMVSRVISNSEGMFNFQISRDDEYDAACILSGRTSHTRQGRYCFQTTYLNERHHEYFEHPDHRIIWVLRNPHSVVYSMVYHWKTFPLNELFLTCGYSWMGHEDRVRFQRHGVRGISRIRQAAYAFNGKVSQVIDIKSNYPAGRLAVLEYDQLVREKDRLFPLLYNFVNLPYKPEYIANVSTQSLGKKNSLDPEEMKIVDDICMPVYEAALKELTIA